MLIKKLYLQNFRCFDELTMNLNAPINLIIGANGSGKTSILESLHYGCHARSFRASSSFDMIRFQQEAFSMRIEGMTAEEQWHIVVGLSPNEKYIKSNDKILSSQKEILHFYRTATITENDVDLITGYPQVRRHFIDTLLIFLAAGYSSLLRAYDQTLKQRSALLASSPFDHLTYEVWTTRFDDLCQKIRYQRTQLLEILNKKMSVLLQEYMGVSSEAFLLRYKTQESDDTILKRERIVQRTLYGAHLDDIEILLHGMPARLFSSRGQQKMLVVLLKIAGLRVVNKPTIVLLDDFMTDFDQNKLNCLLRTLIDENNQLIVTSPTEKNILTTALASYPVNTITLS